MGRMMFFMPSRNSSQFIRVQRDSIFNQSNSTWRLIISGDGSINNTCQIASPYQKKELDKMFFIDELILNELAVL